MRDRRNSKSKFMQMSEDREHCLYCGIKFTKKNKATLDHIYPEWKFGRHANILENYALCCKKCNGSKGGLDPIEWFKLKNILTNKLLAIANSALSAIYSR